MRPHDGVGAAEASIIWMSGIRRGQRIDAFLNI